MPIDIMRFIAVASLAVATALTPAETIDQRLSALKGISSLASAVTPKAISLRECGAAFRFLPHVMMPA